MSYPGKSILNETQKLAIKLRKGPALILGLREGPGTTIYIRYFTFKKAYLFWRAKKYIWFPKKKKSKFKKDQSSFVLEIAFIISFTIL